MQWKRSSVCVIMLVLQCGVVIMRGIRYSLLISGWRKTLEHTMGVIGPIMPIPIVTAFPGVDLGLILILTGILPKPLMDMVPI